MTPFRVTIRNSIFAAAPFLIAQSGGAIAQEPAQSLIPCHQAAPADPAIATELREMSLKPGIRIDPAYFLKDPRIAAFITDVTKQEQARLARDWAGLCRYRADNAAQAAKPAPAVVFIGDSITENWLYAEPERFTGAIIDRGISGQTSAQILLRFRADVVALHPKAVHIVAGTNDILHDNGIVGDDDIVNNISAMIDIAAANRIRVILGSIPPISVRSWRPALQPASRIVGLNDRLQDLARRRRVAYVDYHAILKDAEGGLHADLGNDGVHPNRAGYARMARRLDAALKSFVRGAN